jgi:hypothetical protein
LAGNIATISTANATAAGTRVGGYSSPAAPSSSSTPVTVTSNSGAGRRRGTIAIRSLRNGLTKCATPVTTNIRARPKEIASGQLPTYSTPDQPTTRASSVPTTSAMSGAISNSNLDSD